MRGFLTFSIGALIVLSGCARENTGDSFGGAPATTKAIDRPVPAKETNVKPKQPQSEVRVLLLTPQAHIHQRINEETFIDFVVAMDRSIQDYFDARKANDGCRVQVGCALLPGQKPLLDIQFQPAAAARAHEERLTRVLEQIAVPPVQNGPVAFAWRGVFGDVGEDKEGFSFPFARFIPEKRVRLDDALLEAAGIPPSPNTPHKGAVNRDQVEVSKELARRLNCSVIAAQGYHVVRREGEAIHISVYRVPDAE
jgi:hypothetical protein